MESQITFEWTISTLDCAVSKDGLSNVVETVHWRYSGINENGTTAEVYGSQSVGDPNPNEFTPYQELTAGIVSNWLEGILDVVGMRVSITTQIHNIENPTHVSLPLPTPSVEMTE
jgi:hypothetical protein